MRSLTPPERVQPMNASGSKTVSLVLGSGGARGLAHIGVIRWLEEQGYEIRSIAGTSIGALIGGIYAAGKLDDYEQWVTSIKKVDIVTLLDLSWSKSGLVRGDKIVDTLIDIVGDQQIEDLPVSYTAVAADLKRQKEVWIQSGSLFNAMRASFSIPLLFTPFHINGVDLVDGGILNPVPIAPTFSDQTELTIAVNLGGPEQTSESSRARQDKDAGALSAIQEKIKGFIFRLQGSVVNDAATKDWGAYEIAMGAFDTMQNAIARQRLAAYPPDSVINIPSNACKMLEFERAAELIDLGYKAAGKQLSDAKAEAPEHTVTDIGGTR